MKKETSYSLGLILFAALIVVTTLSICSKLKDQQRQIDELSSAMLNWVKSQELVDEGLGIQVGVNYDVLFIDFSEELAVLTSKNKAGKTEYYIHRNVPQGVLKEWSSKRHFRG